MDYFIENGYKVFTGEYLKSRGHCCHNGCKNCPYKTCKKCGETKLKEQFRKRWDSVDGMYHQCKDCIRQMQKDIKDRKAMYNFF